MSRHLLVVNEFGRFQGGIEANIFATATGLRARGWRVELAVRQRDVDPNFTGAFDAIHPLAPGRSTARSLSDLVRWLQPDIVYAHKVDHAQRWGLGRLQEGGACVIRMVHDHDLVCIRRHRYLPGTLRACDRTATVAHCAGCGLLLERSRGGRLPVAWRPVWERQSDLSASGTLAAVFVASRYMASQMVSNGIPSERVRVVPLGVPDLVRPDSTADAALHFLYVGQMVRTKGLDVLLRALARPALANARLVAVGAGPQDEEFRALAVRLALGDRVHFAGRLALDAVHEHMRAAAAVVMPHRWPEPFGLVGVEAMRAATPVVASDVGGIREWLVPQRTGLVVEPGAPGALSNALAAVLARPEWARQLGERGRERFEAKFTLDRYLDRLEEAFVKACVTRPRKWM